jgi:hypothetical protein
VIMREAQLLVGYPDSPTVSEDVSEDRLAAGPRPGQRAPDCRGLRRDAVSFPMRLFELLRGTGHTLLLYAADEQQGRALAEVATAAAARASGQLRAYLVVSQETELVNLAFPALHDASGEYGAAYDADPKLRLPHPPGRVRRLSSRAGRPDRPSPLPRHHLRLTRTDQQRNGSGRASVAGISRATVSNIVGADQTERVAVCLIRGIESAPSDEVASAVDSTHRLSPVAHARR